MVTQENNEAGDGMGTYWGGEGIVGALERHLETGEA